MNYYVQIGTFLNNLTDSNVAVASFITLSIIMSRLLNVLYINIRLIQTEAKKQMILLITKILINTGEQLNLKYVRHIYALYI